MEICVNATVLQGIVALQNVAHAITALQSCHVHNSITIISPQLWREQNEILNDMNYKEIRSFWLKKTVSVDLANIACSA